MTVVRNVALASFVHLLREFDSRGFHSIIRRHFLREQYVPWYICWSSKTVKGLTQLNHFITNTIDTYIFMKCELAVKKVRQLIQNQPLIYGVRSRALVRPNTVNDACPTRLTLDATPTHAIAQRAL